VAREDVAGEDEQVFGRAGVEPEFLYRAERNSAKVRAEEAVALAHLPEKRRDNLGPFLVDETDGEKGGLVERTQSAGGKVEVVS
jgi:hypothetical protein